jgi:hypothetical protein
VIAAPFVAGKVQATLIDEPTLVVVGATGAFGTVAHKIERTSESTLNPIEFLDYTLNP